MLGVGDSGCALVLSAVPVMPVAPFTERLPIRFEHCIIGVVSAEPVR